MDFVVEDFNKMCYKKILDDLKAFPSLLTSKCKISIPTKYPLIPHKRLFEPQIENQHGKSFVLFLLVKYRHWMFLLS